MYLTPKGLILVQYNPSGINLLHKDMKNIDQCCLMMLILMDIQVDTFQTLRRT